MAQVVVSSAAATGATAPSPKTGTRLTGVLVALVILGIVMFASPPPARLWIAAIVVVMALLARGGDAAAIINNLRQRIYGG
jgi:hypothetical protein